MVGKERAFEIAADAQHLARLLYDYEGAHPQLGCEQDDYDPRCVGPGFAADNAMQLARGLTDWIEGRWNPTEADIESFVVNRMFNIIMATTDDCRINLAADDLLKESWAAMLYASGNPTDANLAEAILSSAKTFDELAREFLSSAWSRELGRKAYKSERVK